MKLQTYKKSILKSFLNEVKRLANFYQAESYVKIIWIKIKTDTATFRRSFSNMHKMQMPIGD